MASLRATTHTVDHHAAVRWRGAGRFHHGLRRRSKFHNASFEFFLTKAIRSILAHRHRFNSKLAEAFSQDGLASVLRRSTMAMRAAAFFAWVMGARVVPRALFINEWASTGLQPYSGVRNMVWQRFLRPTGRYKSAIPEVD